MKLSIISAFAAVLVLAATLPSLAADGLAPTVRSGDDRQAPASLTGEIQALADEGFTVVTPDAPAAAEAGSEAPVAPEVAFTHADDIADLDGDGLLDLIGHVYYEDDSADWIALSGLTGEELYRFPAQPEFTYLASLGTDVDGDGLSELLERRYEYGRSYHEQFEGATCEDCPEGTTRLFENYTTISVRSGGSGQVLWTSDVLADVDHSVRIDEGDHYRAATSIDDTRFAGVVDGQIMLRTRRYESEVVQDFTVAQPIPDAGTLRAGQEQGHRAVDHTMTFSFLDTATGTSVREVVATLDRADSYAGARLGDFDGDGGLDALLVADGPTADEWDCLYVDGERRCTDPVEGSERTPHFQVVDLTDGGVVWEAEPQSDGGFTRAQTIADVDGDGGEDVLVELGSFDDRWAVWNGATGDGVWEREFDGYPRDLGAHDGQTVLTLTETEYLYEDREDDPLDPFDGGQEQVGRLVHRIRVDAATGEEMFRTTSAPQDGGTHVDDGSGPTADYDGDGVDDLWVDETTSEAVQHEDEDGFTYVTYEPVGEPVRYLESGRTGQVLATGLPDADDYDSDVDVYRTADLDGDGGADLRIIDWAGDTTELRRGLGGTLWTLPAAGYVGFPGDLDGDGGADLVQESHCAFTLRNGASGDVVWTTAFC